MVNSIESHVRRLILSATEI